MVFKLLLADMFCMAPPAEQQYLIFIKSFRLYSKFVSFINVLTRIRKVTSQGIYTICCRSFYTKLAFFIELYLILQTDFMARLCFWFSANDSSTAQVFPSLVYFINLP